MRIKSIRNSVSFLTDVAGNPLFFFGSFNSCRIITIFFLFSYLIIYFFYFHVSNVAGFIYVTDVDLHRFVLKMSSYQTIRFTILNATMIFIFDYLNFQEKDNIPCTMCWRTSEQKLNCGNLNMDRKLKVYKCSSHWIFSL